jgi:hypothetical protein
MIVLLLALIPGAGHAFLGRKFRAALYGFGCFGALGIGIVLAAAKQNSDFFYAGASIAAFVFAANLLDIVFTLLLPPEAGTSDIAEKKTVVLLTLIPGLGHLHMGLMNRGLTLLSSFFGLIGMVFFLVFVTGHSEFFVFLFLLAVVWLYGLFDVARQMDRKYRGEPLTDRSIFEDFEEFREEGRKSGIIATFLAVFPGAGHMYLGQQRRGLQLMAAFLISLYLLDALRIGLLLFVIPLLWFFSFFDALQQIGKYRRQALEDEPVLRNVPVHRKWIGIGLLILGLFYLCRQVVLPVLERVFPKVYFTYWFDQYVQTTVLALILIGGGVRLLVGSRRNKEEKM